MVNRFGKGMQAALAGIVIAVFLGGAAAAAAASEVYLFTDSRPSGVANASGPDSPAVVTPGAVRARVVTLAASTTEPGHLSSGDTLVMPLFDDVVYRATVDRLHTNINGTFTLRARIDGYPYGYLLLSTTGGRTLGEVKVPEESRRFTILGEGPGQLLLEMDDTLADELESAPPLVPPSAPARASARILAGEWEPATIDVMVVYTPAARSWAETNGGGMTNVIAQAMEEAQLVNDNSDTLLTMNLVYSAEVDYAEVDCDTDLWRLTLTNDGHMDAVHTWRKQHQADLVALFARTDDCGGIGWVLIGPAGQPAFGFSITRVQQAAWTYTHIHEMGHNMGLHHHREQNFQPGPGIFPYSAGWRWVGTDDGRYCSVMTYENGDYFADGQDHTRVAHFSNPSISFAGVATGHAQHADNARTVRQTKHAVAGYSEAADPWGVAMTVGAYPASTISASRPANHLVLGLLLPLAGIHVLRRRYRRKG